MPQRAKNIAWGSAWLLLAAWLFGGLPSFTLPGGSAPWPSDVPTVFVERNPNVRLLGPQFDVLNGPVWRGIPAKQKADYDLGQSAAKDNPWVAQAQAAVKARNIKPPVMGISGPKGGDVFPLPKDEAEFAALWKKYGG